MADDKKTWIWFSFGDKVEETERLFAVRVVAADVEEAKRLVDEHVSEGGLVGPGEYLESYGQDWFLQELSRDGLLAAEGEYARLAYEGDTAKVR